LGPRRSCPDAGIPASAYADQLKISAYDAGTPRAGCSLLNLMLRSFLDRHCGQLQYCRPLPGNQIGEENDRAVRELERIVMLVGLVEFYLTKPRQAVANFPAKDDTVSLNVLFERELGTWTKANGDAGVARTGKASRGGSWELRGNERLRDFGGTGCHRM
jgi:hypothetical protein